MFDLVVKHGALVTGGEPFVADLAVSGEKIAAFGSGLQGRQIIDAQDCYVIPGAVDPHVHLQMPLAGRVSSDDFASGTVAAAFGGTTTIIDFVTPEPGQTMLDALARRQEEAKGKATIDYGLHMTVPAWHAADDARLDEIPVVMAAGCATFKMYQAYAGMMLDDEALFRALQAVGRAGGLTVLHSETGPVLDRLRNQAVAAGHTSPIWHAYTRPARLEATAVHRAAELAHLAGCPLYVFHIGCAEALAEVAAAQRRGVIVWAETCPQYLLLSADEYLAGAQGELFVCAPPLRGHADQTALWEALKRRDLAVVSTDHCPWTQAEKQQPDFTQIPGGVPSIEGRLSLVYHFGVSAGKISLPRWVEICCTAPAQLMGCTTKGRLAPGYDADLVVFDPHRDQTICVESLHERAGWTPYDGVRVTGWPRTVLSRGRVIVENEVFAGEQGAGRYITRRFY